MSERPQSFESHASVVPLYHYGATALIVLPTLYFAWLTATSFSLERLATLGFAVGVVLVGFYARTFPLRVQDRVIRLEERMRLQRLLPADLQPRIAGITKEQLIGLRFASDDELVELVRRVLDEGLEDRKSIKAAVRTWRPDHVRI
jgi:hypothetical protein